MKEEWINKLKIGDPVLTVERWHNEVHRHVSAVTAIEPSYIETKFRREFRPEWAKFFHAFNENKVKNYFSPDGDINIEPIN